MRGRLDARRTLKSLVADLRIDKIGQAIEKLFRYSLLGLYYSLHGTVRIIL